MNDHGARPRPRKEPGIASAEEGVVLLDGPDGLAITWTAQAAAQTGQNLLNAAAVAEGQTPARGDDAPGEIGDPDRP